MIPQRECARLRSKQGIGNHNKARRGGLKLCLGCTLASRSTIQQQANGWQRFQCAKISH
jgi:hypothetical protein